MGQHLQICASKNISIEDAGVWWECRAWEILRSPSREQQLCVDRVQAEMDRIERTEDHIEHWASGGGVACFGLLLDRARLCDLALISEAVEAGREYQEFQKKHNPGSAYAKHDWANDSAVEFLRSHIGYTIWAYNDGY